MQNSKRITVMVPHPSSGDCYVKVGDLEIPTDFSLLERDGWAVTWTEEDQHGRRFLTMECRPPMIYTPR
jgi:hypothetical protein